MGAERAAHAQPLLAAAVGSISGGTDCTRGVRGVRNVSRHCPLAVVSIHAAWAF